MLDDQNRNVRYIVDQASLWFDGVVFQGNRLSIIAHDLSSRHDRNYDYFRRKFKLYNIELFFFIQSLDRSVEFLKQAVPYILEFSEIIKEIESIASLKDIKDIRDMNVHLVDYLKNKGRRQNKFFSFDGYISADATSSIFTKEGFLLIGNRVNATKLINKYVELGTQVNKLCSDFERKMFVESI